MKYLIIRLLWGTLILAASTPLQAQIHNPQQRMVEVGGGFLDGVKPMRQDNSGRWLRLVLGKYGRREGVWQMGLLAQVKFYALPDASLVGVKEYLLEGTFTPKLLRSADRTWYLSPTLGIVTGYESVDDRRIDTSGETQWSKFLLGCTGGFTGEWNMTHRVTLIGYARGNYVGSSKVQPFHFYGGMGLRINYFSE